MEGRGGGGGRGGARRRVEEQLQRKPAGAAAAKAAVRAMLQSSEQLSSIVGRRVKIFWPGDGVWYTATVGGYDGACTHPLLALLVVCGALAAVERGALLAENSELHKIDYDDGEPKPPQSSPGKLLSDGGLLVQGRLTGMT